MARGENERLTERDGTQILHVERARHGDDAPCPIGLAHGLIKKRGNDAAVRVPGRTGEAASEAKAADDVLVGVGEEAKAEAARVIQPTTEAVIQGAVSERREPGLLA